MPRHHKLDTGVRIERIPQDVRNKAENGNDKKDKEQDNEGEDKSIDGFLFLALWWLLRY